MIEDEKGNKNMKVRAKYNKKKNQIYVVYKMYILGQPEIPENIYWGKTNQNDFDRGQRLRCHKSMNRASLIRPVNKRIQAKLIEFGQDCLIMRAVCRDMLYISACALEKMYIGDDDIYMNLLGSPEINKKISSALKGRIISDEHRAKLSITNKGRKNGFYGRKHTDATKEKIAASKIGKKHTDATKAKMSISSKGKNKGRIPWNKGLKISNER